MHIIAGTFRHRSLHTPKGETTRPTASQTREAVFNICQTYIENAYFLDLYAGSGAMGLEALSRGAAHATFIDNHKDAYRCLQSNIENLDIAHQTTLYFGDVLQMLKRLTKESQRYDIIYADPPYEQKETPSDLAFGKKTLHFLDEFPLLADQGVLFIEDSPFAELEKESLQHLSLKKERRFGKSALYQFIYKTS